MLTAKTADGVFTGSDRPTAEKMKSHSLMTVSADSRVGGTRTNRRRQVMVAGPAEQCETDVPDEGACRSLSRFRLGRDIVC